MINDYMTVQRESKMPIRKKMKKLGTLKIGTVETTPVVWKDELLMFEWVRSNLWGNGGHKSRKTGYYQFFDIKTDEPKSSPFAHEHAFGCCYAEDDVMYVHGVRGNGGQTKYIDVFQSEDLKNWESKLALELPEELKVYNTSVCKGKDGTYVMAVEVGGPEELIGKNYTIFLDRETLTLFGYIEIEDEALWAKGADTAINRKWWDFMADIMETNPDRSPVSKDLQMVFHLD